MLKTLSFKQALWIVSLAILVFISTWALNHYLPHSHSLGLQTQHQPDAFAENVHILRTGVTGKAADELFIPQMLHFTYNNLTIFAKPMLAIFTQMNKPAWRITAEQGQAYQGTNRIELWNNVHVQQLGQNAMALSTDHLTVMPQMQMAKTSAPVILSQAGNQIRGTGLRIDLKRGEVELLSKTQGYYAPDKR